jgi:tungstate transport system ATP-binding protein
MRDAVTATEAGKSAATVDARANATLPCEAKGLTFIANDNRIIDNVDLTMADGPVTMIMGPNGAGKSVLVRLLHGMLKPTAGKISWGGRPLDDTARKRQAMIFQAPVLLRRSVAANISFVLSLRGRAYRDRCEEILSMVGLAEHAGRPARLLSGGERQRLAIARALASEPDVLFLDEPTASLDPASVVAIEQIVTDIRDSGVKIIFITHDVGQARRLGDEVVFIHKGRIVEQVPTATFFDNPKSREARDYLAGRIVL